MQYIYNKYLNLANNSLIFNKKKNTVPVPGTWYLRYLTGTRSRAYPTLVYIL